MQTRDVKQSIRYDNKENRWPVHPSHKRNQEIVKSFIDLANMAKGLMDENQQPSVQQELERLFPGRKGGRRGGEIRELHGVGAEESSASTTTDTNTSFTTPSTTKRTIAEILEIKKLWRLPVNLLFFPCKTL